MVVFVGKLEEIFFCTGMMLWTKVRKQAQIFFTLALRFLSMALTLVPLLTLTNSTMNKVTQSLRDSFRLHVNIIRDLEDNVSKLQRETSLIENDIDWSLENALLYHFSYQEHALFTREKVDSIVIVGNVYGRD